MNKIFFQVICLSAVITYFENITIANATDCLEITDAQSCKLDRDCGWVEDLADRQQLYKTLPPNSKFRSTRCFLLGFLERNACAFQKTIENCLIVQGCTWDLEAMSGKGKCIVPKTASPNASTEVTPLSVCSPRKSPADCSDRTQQGKCFWKSNFFGNGGKCLPVGSTVKK